MQFGFPSTDLPDATVAQNFADHDAFFDTYDMPHSNLVVPQFYNIGSNVFDELAARGYQFIVTQQEVGRDYFDPNVTVYYSAPYRRFEAPGTPRDLFNVLHADYVTIPNHPEL